MAWDTDIDSLDPHAFKSIGGYVVQCNLYDPTRRGRSGRSRAPGLLRSLPNEFEGSIAEIWTFERDGATIVLKVRPGMTLPSGRPVDAPRSNIRSTAACSRRATCVHLAEHAQVAKPEQIVVRDPMTHRARDEGPEPQPMVLDFLSLMTNTVLDPD